MEEWFQTCDRILNIHRAEFLLKDPTPEQLREHKIGVGECIEHCELMAKQLTMIRRNNVKSFQGCKLASRNYETPTTRSITGLFRTRKPKLS